MKVRQDDMAVLGKAAVLLSRREDLRIGQLMYNAITSTKWTLESLFYVEDEDLLNLIELYLAGAAAMKRRPDV